MLHHKTCHQKRVCLEVHVMLKHTLAGAKPGLHPHHCTQRHCVRLLPPRQKAKLTGGCRICGATKGKANTPGSSSVPQPLTGILSGPHAHSLTLSRLLHTKTACICLNKQYSYPTATPVHMTKDALALIATTNAWTLPLCMVACTTR
jgi:hypothetical protein